MEIIWDTCFTDAEIRSALQSLPKDLEETYRRCLHRINFHDPRALKTLTWVSFANNSLHIEELKEAVAFNLHDTNWNKEQLPRTDFILGSCANLITMDPTNYSIHFAHSSVKQYLEKYSRHLHGYPLSRIEGDLQCGEFCIAYLSFSDFFLQLDRTRNMTASVRLPGTVLMAQKAIGFAFNKRLLGTNGGQENSATISFNIIPPSSEPDGTKPDGTKYRFLDYAIENWALHTRHITTGSPVWDKYERLATTFSEKWNFHSWIPSSCAPSSQIHAMFAWAVVEQHEPLLSILSTHGSELQHVCDIPLSEGGLPALHFATESGFEKIVQMLLKICDVNRQDKHGYTALHYAAAKGHVSIVYMLRKKDGIKVDLRSETGLTPLWLAAVNGHVEVLQALLKNMMDIEAQIPCPLPKANVDVIDFDHQTPLITAAKNGYLEVVECLVSYGADAEARDAIGRTSLAWAIIGLHYHVMDFFFELGLNWVPLSVGYEELLPKHLKRNSFDIINIPAKDLDHRTPFSWAAVNGHSAVVKLLLGKNKNSKSRAIRTEAIMSLLVQQTINDFIELSFTPIPGRRIKWSGYMMSCNLPDHDGVWRYFVLRGHSLTIYKSWATVSEDEMLTSLDMGLYYPTLARPPCNLCGLPPEKSCLEIPEPSVGSNDQLHHFFVRHGSHTINDRLAGQYGQRRQCFHFAVTTERERIDWVRELMLVGAD